MATAVPKNDPDFSRPIEADFVVSLRTKSGSYDLFVEAFTKKNGKAYLRHTEDIREAKRFSKLTAFDVAKQVAEYRCTGRLERVSGDGMEREVVTTSGDYIVDGPKDAAKGVTH